MLTYIIIMALCLVLSAYFSATETAFSTMNKTRMKTLAEKGNRKAQLALTIAERYDRMLSTNFGVHAAQLIAQENYGQAVAMLGSTVGHNPLKEVAGKTKFVPLDHQLIETARQIGICLGD